MNSIISKEFLTSALTAFDKYKRDKEALSLRIRENNYWYKARYGKIINPANNETLPSTAFILSAIENKFSDALDSFPVPNILGRTPGNENISEVLSKIVPTQLELSDFKNAYKVNWRRKLKHGTGIYGIFYADNKITVKALSILNVYCDMHVNDVQQSQFLFIVNAVSNKKLINDYPQYAQLFSGNTSVETFDGTHEAEDKSEIIDCYYKKGNAVHCMKLCAKQIIASTEDEGLENGLYEHGNFPVVFDILYPEEDCPFGFGIIDVAKNPQMYIDKLDGAIIKNSILSSKIRFLIKDNGAINEDEVINCDNDIIHVAGGIDNDSIRELQISNISSSVMDHRSKKIEELKEIVGNRDFQQGATNNGVTAASAITLLQETGGKLSRSMISDSYDCYKKIVLIVIELMRQFFIEKHIFRITDSNGNTSYAGLSSEDLFYNRDMTEHRPIEFDIEVVPQRDTPFQMESNNKTIMELWNSGIFNPDNIEGGIVAVSAMKFDGKEQLLEKLKEFREKLRHIEQIKSGELIPVNDETIAMNIG